MQDFPMDCLIGKVCSVVKLKKTYQVILQIGSFYGDFSLYGKSNGKYVSMNLDGNELGKFKDFIYKNHDYYEKEFDFESEIEFGMDDQDSELTQFSKMKIVTEGIVVGVKGNIGNEIFKDYGIAKFAGFIFMNKHLFNGLKSVSFNNILMTSELKENLITQNSFNFLIPVGNLKSSLRIITKALIVK